jgi:predicted Rossmann fold flavoprotein
MSWDVAVVGAGAAGLATAAFVRELSPTTSVAVLEGAKRPGAKILVSGGGRCNVTNARVSERDFWGGPSSVVRQVLRSFPVRDTVQFFSRMGVGLHEEAHGKHFPNSNRARDVLDALLNEVAKSGGHLLADHRVTEVWKRAEGFLLSSSQGPIEARVVVIATGGRSLPKSGSDGSGYQFAARLGHTIVETTPALVPLLLNGGDTPLHTLSGVAHDAELTLWVDGRVATRLSGSLLWTHFGISGPLALDASRHWARATLEGRTVEVTLNFLPGTSFEDMDGQLVARARQRPRATMQTLLAGLLPASVAASLISAAGIDPSAEAAQIVRADRRRLAHALVEWTLGVKDTRGYNYAEVTAGGVALTEVSPRTLESRVCPGLYFVGEVLDIDGRLGGFNFQWAWSSARVVARALAR